MNFKTFVPSRKRFNAELAAFVDGLLSVIIIGLSPFISIWALNTLFGLGIVEGYATYMAMFYVHTLVLLTVTYLNEK
jgi:hypothetical protein|tara:strand:- start:4154 stop:4384 length:231 start_codon:yes stop_codon:yes gene_type:complete